MTFLFISVFLMIPLVYVTGDWPVPKSIKCNSTGTFHCKNTGKYEDPFDFTCTRYYLCNDFEHETVEVELTCPENTLYDPVNENCSSEYKCICDDATISNVPSTTSSPSRTETPTPHECEICSQCITSIGIKTTDSTIWTTNPSKSSTIDEEDISTTGEFINTTTVNSESTLLTTFINNNTTLMTRSPETTFSTERSTTTSTLPHKYCSSEEKFTCVRTGRFANPNDTLCNSYFYCYVWSDGRVGQYLYSCSVGLFNPSKGGCDQTYSCPFTETSSSTTQLPASNGTYPVSSTQSSITTEFPTVSSITVNHCNTEENFTCIETGRFVNPKDFSCKSYFYCYSRSNDTVGQYLYSCSVGLFNPSKGGCDLTYSCPCTETSSSTTQLPASNGTYPVSSTQSSITTEFPTVSSITVNHCNTEENFTCIETGRFVNPKDFSCKSYFYCYSRSNNTVGQYLYSCSVGLFNPSKGGCDLTYSCPCTETSSSTTQLPASNGTYPVSSTQSSITTEIPTVSSITVNHCNTEENFTCIETGRFVNPKDFSCKSYFYCYSRSNDTVGQYLYSCSVGLFNPSKGGCDLTYSCPCTETSSSTTQLPASNGTYPVSSTQSSITTEFPTVSSITVNHCNTEENFTCIETGRFVNPKDFSCKSFFYCYSRSNDTVGQYLYSCSVGLFNPSKDGCDPTYSCPCTETSSSTTQLPASNGTYPVSSTQSSITTEFPTVSSITANHCNTEENFTCIETGRFVNPKDFSCKSYFYCYSRSNGTVGQYLYSCSVGLFNPSIGGCDLTYSCPCTETSSSTTQLPASNGTHPLSSTQSSKTTEFSTVSSITANHCNTEENFTCVETGRFVNPKDFSCKSYVYCYSRSNGTVGQYLYSCSIGLFNPSKGACDLSYVCPCPRADVTESAATSIITQLPYSTTTTSSSSTPIFSTTESTTNFTETAAYCNLGGNFTCSITGRFANPNDSSCSSYFYCYVWSSGKVEQYLYSCSDGFFFNPHTGACDYIYVCPCTETNKSVSINQRSAAENGIDKTFTWPSWLFQSFNGPNNTQTLH